MWDFKIQDLKMTKTGLARPENDWPDSRCGKLRNGKYAIAFSFSRSVFPVGIFWTRKRVRGPRWLRTLFFFLLLLLLSDFSFPEALSFLNPS